MNWTRPACCIALLLMLGVATGLAEAAQKQRPTGKSASPRPTPESSAPSLSRPRVTERDQELAEVPDIPDARFWGDSAQEFLRVLPPRAGPWLALSGGGSDGAFGAGLLKGWSETGERPDFAVVTGVSAGALIAPFAFAGSRYDDELREAFTSVNAGDVFEAASTGESLFDTWPLRATIAKRITMRLLSEVAEEHRRGRRLFVLTTNLDAERPVAWNMGAIAAKGDQAALDLFRSVLLASSSVPGLFPPVYIEVLGNGRRFREMHVDGGASAPFYIAPTEIIHGATPLPISELYVVANTKLTPEFQVVTRDTPAILGRAVAKTLKLGIRLEAAVVAAAMQRRGAPFAFSFIPAGFQATSRGAFDPDYMSALFRAGEEQARSSAPFTAMTHTDKAAGRTGGETSTTGAGNQ